MNLGNNENRIWGIILIAIGVAFLAMQQFSWDIMAYLWPGFIIVPGALVTLNAFQGESLKTEQFIGGTATLATGLLLLAMMLTGRWYAWSYAWGIYPVVTGAAMVYAARRNNQPDLEERGIQTLRAGVVMLAAFGIFFEVFIFSGVSEGFENFWPVVLIGLGGFFLFRGRSNSSGDAGKPKRKSKNDEDEIVTL